MGALVILLVSFVVGSIPVANLFARVTRGVDLREVETGTVSGTGLYRVAGFTWLAVAGILDIAKGAVGPLLAGSGRPGLAAVAGGLAVAGHDWSPFLRGAGGRGIAPAVGALLVNAWVGAVLLLAALGLGRLARRTGLFTFVAEVVLTPVLALTDGGVGALAGLAVATPMLLKRVTGNAPAARTDASVDTARHRIYVHRLLYDRDPAPGRP